MKKNFFISSLLLLSITAASQITKHYDHVESIVIDSSHIMIIEKQLSPAEVRRNYKSVAGGGCSGFSYHIYEYNNLLYCFFSSDISFKLNQVKKDLSEPTSYLKYYPKDKCLVVKLLDQRDRRNLQGYFTGTFCNNTKK